MWRFALGRLLRYFSPPLLRDTLYIDRQIKFRGSVYCPAIACEAHNIWPLWV